MDIGFTKEEYDAKLEYLIEAISKIVCYSHCSWHGRRMMLAYLPEIKDIPTERTYQETINITKNGEIARLNTGKGYIDEKCLARREYCEMKGVRYNFSEWEIFNKTQLNGYN